VKKQVSSTVAAVVIIVVLVVVLVVGFLVFRGKQGGPPQTMEDMSQKGKGKAFMKGGLTPPGGGTGSTGGTSTGQGVPGGGSQ
jgi:hypothetical protein